MNTFTQYFSVRVDHIIDLMNWGKALMNERKADVTTLMKESNISLDMMVILDQAVVENGDDNDELLVMNVTHYTGRIKPISMRRRFNREFRDVFEKLLKPLSDDNDDLLSNINVQNATFVYLLTE